jgi:hypothetical protein
MDSRSEELLAIAADSLALAGAPVAEDSMHGAAEVYTVGPGERGERLWTCPLSAAVADIVAEAGGGDSSVIALPQGGEHEVGDCCVGDAVRLANGERVVLRLP